MSKLGQAFRSTVDFILDFDSLTDINQRNITNYILLNEMQMSYLIDIVQGSPAKNSEQSRDDLVKLVKSKMKLPDKSFLSMTCDSAGVYFKARKLLKEMDGLPFTLVSGCMAHQSNLFLKDLIKRVPIVSESIDHAAKIAAMLSKSVAFHAALCAEINSKEGKAVESIAIWVPCATCWYSYGMCLKQVIRILDFIHKTLINEKDKPYYKKSKKIKAVEGIVKSDNVNTNMIQADKLLSPFNFVTAFSEMDCILSGMIFCLWIWISGLVNETRLIEAESKQSFKEKILKRIRLYGEEHHMVSLLIDPRVHGTGLSSKGRRKVIAMTMQLA